MVASTSNLGVLYNEFHGLVVKCGDFEEIKKYYDLMPFILKKDCMLISYNVEDYYSGDKLEIELAEKFAEMAEKSFNCEGSINDNLKEFDKYMQMYFKYKRVVCEDSLKTEIATLEREQERLEGELEWQVNHKRIAVIQNRLTEIGERLSELVTEVIDRDMEGDESE